MSDLDQFTRTEREFRDALAARDAEVARLRSAIVELVAADSESIPDEDRVEAAWQAAIAALAQPKEPT